MEQPELLPGEEWYLSAFWELSSERIGSGSQTLGRIPWSRALMFGAYHGLEEPMLSAFWKYVSAMDMGYLQFMKNEHERHTRYQKKKPAASSKSPRYTRS